jgi:type I restriction enzyme S subunit
MANLRRGWKPVGLGDVVDVVTDYWDRNLDVPERCVGGEHIDEGDLRVPRWGMTSDELVPPTFNRRFRAGDVLFHSRNLKKLACPDFDGITGEKLFVLRSKDPKSLLPELLPFLLQTNAFNEYVNRMWAGSTNKFLNKGPLVKYEFALPPLEEQRRIAEMARTTASAISAIDDATTSAAALYRSLSLELLRPKTGWNSVPLEQLTDPTAPICYGIVQLGKPRTEGVPVLRTQNLNGDYQDLYFASPELDQAYRRSRVQGGDILIAIQGASTGKIGIVPSGFSGNINRHVARVRLRTSTSSEFFLHLWKSPLFARYATSNAVGSTKPELTIGTLRALRVPCPSVEEQREISDALGAAADGERLLVDRASAVRGLLRRSIETSLEGS